MRVATFHALPTPLSGAVTPRLKGSFVCGKNPSVAVGTSCECPGTEAQDALALRGLRTPPAAGLGCVHAPRKPIVAAHTWQGGWDSQKEALMP